MTWKCLQFRYEFEVLLLHEVKDTIREAVTCNIRCLNKGFQSRYSPPDYYPLRMTKDELQMFRSLFSAGCYLQFRGGDYIQVDGGISNWMANISNCMVSEGTRQRQFHPTCFTAPEKVTENNTESTTDLEPVL